MYNLIWVQLEAYGSLNEEKNSILNDALKQISFEAIHLSQTVCAAPSTVMTTMGLLTGVSPVFLAKDHIPKREQIPDDWQASGFTTITDFLDKQNYDVMGINAVYDSPRCLPMFKDTHAGVTAEMRKKEGYNFWESWCVVQRLKNIKASLHNGPKALLFHLMDADILPQLLQELDEIGMHKNNTVLVLVGDHGWPIRFKEKEPALFHDLHQEENNIRVSCHLAYPDSSINSYDHFSSALDLAPTVLDIMGFNPQEVLPKAHGISLKPYLDNNTPSPDRIVRIDNRYIAQRKNKIITLVNSKLRYTFRYETTWEQQPYYQYRFRPVESREELFCRNDIEEKVNLISDQTYSKELEEFRQFFEESETNVINHFYSKNLFKHYLLSEHRISENKHINQRRHSSNRIQRNLLKLLKEEIEKSDISKIALYGAGNHTRSILATDIINSYVTVILDDNPLLEKLYEIQVAHTEDQFKFPFEALLISSDYFEQDLKKRALEWLPKEKNILTLYDNTGQNLSTLLAQKLPGLDFDEVINKVLSFTSPNSVLSLSQSNLVSIENYKGYLYSPKIGLNTNLAFKKVSKKITNVKFDLIIYKSKNIMEFVEWLSQADNLLEPCGIFLAELPATCTETFKSDLSSLIHHDLKYEILHSKSSTVVISHLWRFNS